MWASSGDTGHTPQVTSDELGKNKDTSNDHEVTVRETPKGSYSCC